MAPDVGMPEVQAWAHATLPIAGWIAGAHALALLRAALDSGILARAGTTRSVAELAGAAGLAAPEVDALCLALEAHGILDRDGPGYRLTPPFALVSAPDAFLPLADLLASEQVTSPLLATAGAPGGPAAGLPPRAMLAVARANSASPSSPMGRAWVTELLAQLPELQAGLAAGGRHLELGCGAGGTLLGPLALYPQASGVGVELDEAVVEEAWGRAIAAGVADRVEIRHADARDLDDQAAFDSLWWSQQFFPSVCRAAVLAGAHRALKPGGLFIAPILGEPPASVAALREPNGRGYAVNHLVNLRRGIPWRTAAQLTAEVETAGFTVARVASVPLLGRLLVARRPSVN
jgi:SAM-dependent methyltransferase